ncbi:hypothetical protein PsYK624_090310 [Phanerochaete sordida]|uniref:Uncharacterized protein n=1 Tax=Phanerochaete sordida TaxID=48140 RepID=A0A9P3GDG2_9APHY|nr:hypothetical protein PsYK624_090310 [Phanerochaete sordida]
MATPATGIAYSTSWNNTLASTRPGNMSTASQPEDALLARPVTTPLRHAGPSLEQIAARVVARKQQAALRDAENVASRLDGVLTSMLKGYLLSDSRSGSDIAHGPRQALAPLQNTTPTRTPTHTPRSILKQGGSRGKKPFPASVSWSAETRVHPVPPRSPSDAPLPPLTRFASTREHARREVVYETARPSYPWHLLRSRGDRIALGASFARADLPPVSADEFAYAVRYLAGLVPLPSLPRTGPVTAFGQLDLDVSLSSSSSSIASASSDNTDVLGPALHTRKSQMRLRGDAPTFLPAALARAPADGCAGEPRPTAPAPGPCSAPVLADATS